MRVAVGLLVGGAVGVVVVWRSWDASALGHNRWAAAAAVVVMAWVAAVIPAVQRLLPTPAHLPAMLGAVTFAIYGCVPETGQIPPVAVAVTLLTVIELGTHRLLPPVALTAAAGLVMWSGMFGATGRDSALVGTLFAFWPLVLVAAVSARSLHTSTAGSDAPHGSIPAIAAAVVGSLAAIAVARTGALRPTIAPALRAVAVAAPVSVLAAVIAALLLRKRRAHPLHRGG